MSNGAPQGPFVTAINQQFTAAVREAEADIKYYAKEAKKYSFWSWVVLGTAIGALIIGTLAPLFRAVGLSQLTIAGKPLDVLSLGYLALGFAAAFMVIDRFVLLTENNVSKMVTKVGLDALLERLRLEETTTKALANDEQKAEALLPGVKATLLQFALDRSAMVSGETATWGTARRSAQGQLSDLIASAQNGAKAEIKAQQTDQIDQLNKNKPGAVRAAITNTPKYMGEVKFVIDYDDPAMADYEKLYTTVPLVVARAGLAPGVAHLRLTRESQGKVQILAEDVVIVEPGKVAAATLKLPETL